MEPLAGTLLRHLGHVPPFCAGGRPTLLRRDLPRGLLLGYAVTIRYTEGLLVLPIAIVFLMTVHLRRPSSWLRAAVPTIAWLVPVGARVAFKEIAMGSWTGYDTTNESTGFSWPEFQNKWEFMAQQLYDYGLFFVVPLAVLGFVAMYQASWRVGLLLTLWFVPARGGVHRVLLG